LSKAEAQSDLLLARYVKCFERFDEMLSYGGMNSAADELALPTANELGQIGWRPRRVEPNPELLDVLYRRIPTRFPRLFERLLLTFRWAEVSLDTYSLMENPVGPNLDGFYTAISKDRGLWDPLASAGFIRFGKGPDMNYDPICFDMNSRRKSGEMKVVRIDHEEVLCNMRIKIVSELAPNFESLVRGTIAAAGEKQS